MVLQNLLDGGPSHSGPHLGPSQSMGASIPGTNHRPCVIYSIPLWITLYGIYIIQLNLGRLAYNYHIVSMC
jgi:hypothetical protein